ncbi:MAG: hypothetical protein MJZ23_04045 [Paludibacteraceae bacterium]|nr:hypothetical protein [Paludibacteraceae bacterium]
MRLRLSILLVSSLLSIASAFACGGEWRTPNCYMFSVYNRNEQNTFVLKQNVKFWQRYTGNRFSDEQILTQLNNKGNDAGINNLLHNYLSNKGDKNAVEYLNKLKEVKKASEFNENNWEYPSKSQIEENKKQWQSIYKFAMGKVKGKRTPLQNRYVLMAIRGAFYSGNHDAVSEIWIQNAKQVTEKDIAIMCQGYLANGWIKSGWTEKARDFYIKSGSLNDLRASFPQNITTATIKDVFDKYPESNSFPYLVQYYLNSIDSDLHPRSGEVSAKTDSLTKIELIRFVKFATGAVAANTKQNALWQSAKAYAIYLLGDKKTALSELYKAQKMKSTARVAYNTRCLILLCKAELEDLTNKFELTLTKEITWLRNTATHEKPYYDYADYRFRNHYTDVMDHLVHDILVPRYMANENVTTSALLVNMANELNETQNNINLRCTLIKRDSTQKGWNGDYCNDIFHMLDTLNIDQVTAYYKIMAEGSGNDFERSLVQFCYPNSSYIADIIGTKYMRDFKFKEAIEWLKKVDPKFAVDMNIIPYLGNSYNTEYWVSFQHQPQSAKMKKLYANKINFCKDMLKLETNVSKAQQKRKLDSKYVQSAYDLAVAYTQASPIGACWALTNYSWSSVQDSAAIASNNYIKRAQALLRSAYGADMREENMIRCLQGLFFLGSFSPSGDHEKMAKILWRLKDTPTGVERKIYKCDKLLNYISRAN